MAGARHSRLPARAGHRDLVQPGPLPAASTPATPSGRAIPRRLTTRHRLARLRDRTGRSSGSPFEPPIRQVHSSAAGSTASGRPSRRAWIRHGATSSISGSSEAIRSARWRTSNRHTSIGWPARSRAIGIWSPAPGWSRPNSIAAGSTAAFGRRGKPVVRPEPGNGRESDRPSIRPIERRSGMND